MGRKLGGWNSYGWMTKMPMCKLHSGFSALFFFFFGFPRCCLFLFLFLFSFDFLGSWVWWCLFYLFILFKCDYFFLGMFFIFNKFRWLYCFLVVCHFFVLIGHQFFNKDIWVSLYKLTFSVPKLFHSQLDVAKWVGHVGFGSG